MNKCSAVLCNTKRNNAYSYFRFPTEISEFTIWANSCGRPDLIKKFIPNLTKQKQQLWLCEKHFKVSDVIQGQRKLLKKNAKPFSLNIVVKSKKNSFPSTSANFISIEEKEDNDKLQLAHITIEDLPPGFGDLACVVLPESSTKSQVVDMGDSFSTVQEKTNLEFRDSATPAYVALPEPPTKILMVDIGDSFSTVQVKTKLDLVSPQRLMNITENMCPLLRPISPPTCVGDGNNYASPTPEISVISLSDEEMHVKRESEKKPNVVQPLSSGHILLGLITTTTTASTTTITTSTTTTTPSSTYVTLKAVVPKGEVNSSSVKRPFSPNSHSEDSVAAEPGARKYKKILPKHESSPETNFPSLHYIELPPISEESEGVVLNLSGLGIQKLEKTCKGAPPAQATSLYLDNNFLQTLPTIDSYSRLSKLSLVNNQIDSLIWFGFLPTLRTLNLAKNRISNIDGLWKMWHLTHVNLSENKISALQGQASKPTSNLEHLDVSCNSIANIGDLSMLTRLKELLFHKNRIKTLINCRLKFPDSLTKFTLAENLITNLGDIVELSDLSLLKELTLKHNACNNALQLVDKRGNWVGTPRAFDYRPYVLTFCPSLASLDGGPITVEERVKAEWLIDEGKLRTMNVQKHALLVTYLAEVCPKSVLSQVKEQTLPPSLNNNITSVKDMSQSKGTTLHTKKLLKDQTRFRKSENRNTESDCSNEFPCKHYVELIEEKAKNYKLQRTNDSLMELNEDLQHRIHVLETTLIENGFNIDDLFVKLEVDEEELGI